MALRSPSFSSRLEAFPWNPCQSPCESEKMPPKAKQQKQEENVNLGPATQ